MAIDRRSLLFGVGALAAARPVAAFSDASREPAFVSCCRQPDGEFAAIVLNAEGEILYSEKLDGRGHDAAISPDRSLAVVFARRPGRFALALDLKQRRRPLAFAPPVGRHFYGHGFFSSRGNLLYATENDFEAERGVLGIYDVDAGFRRTGEIPTHGIGPHEAILMADDRTICVANGGIATHPDYPRQKLNLPTMAPCLTYLDAVTGDMIEKVDLGRQNRYLSLRHMTETGGRIWFGGQYEGARTDNIALVGVHEPGKEIALVDARPDQYARMNHYIGSVAASRDGRRIAAASPRGGRLIVWDAMTRNVLETRPMPDICGLAPNADNFLMTGGRYLRNGPKTISQQDGFHWDNHVAFAGPTSNRAD